MLWLDVSYLKQIGGRLERFKEKKPNALWNCRCPLCGDSAKKKKKARGFFYALGNDVLYKCHNCMASMSFNKFLKTFDPNLFDRYRLERFKAESNNDHVRKVEPEFKTPPATRQYVPNIVADLDSLDDLPADHPAMSYIRDRKIPERLWGSLFYAPKFFEWTKGHTDKFSKFDGGDHPRLVIPWYSEDGVIFCYHARAFGPEEPKYYSIVLKKDYDQFYGLERFDPTKRHYIVEGPLDSLFLPNCLAVGTASLLKYDYPDRDAVYIPDRDTRNKEVMALAEKLVKANKQVCLLPHDFPGKDINAAIQAGMTPQEVLAIVEAHTYSGLSLVLNFNVWRKL